MQSMGFGPRPPTMRISCKLVEQVIQRQIPWQNHHCFCCRSLHINTTALVQSIDIMKAGTLVAGFFIVAVFLPVLAILSILSVIFQLFVLTYTKIFRPDLSLIFAGSELQYAMESIYRRPKVNTVIHCIFDGQIQLDYVRRQFERRVINYCDAQGNLRYQKLRQTWTQLCGYMFWKWDKHFSLRNQIRLYDYTEPELAIPSPCTEQDVSRVTGALISKPYMAGRSPWEILLIPNYHYVDSDGQTCNGSVLTFKLHHFLADGLSMFKLLNHLFQMRLPVPSANFPKLSPLQKCLRLATMAFKFPVDVAKIMTLGRDDPNSWHLTDKKLTRRYVTLASDRIPVPTIKAIKNKHCVGYNAAVYAVTVGAISRFMAAAGQEVPKSMTGYCPFPLPNHPGGLVNHW